MKKVKLLSVVVAVVVIVGLLIAGCGQPAAPTTPTTPTTPTAPAEPIKLRVLTFGNQHPPTNGMNAVVNPAWSNYLKEKSGGRIELELVTSSAAAAPPDLYDAARTGVVDIACQMPSFVPGRWILNSVTELPFIFDYPGSMAAARAQWALFKKYPEIQAEMGEGADVKVIGFHNNGLTQFHTKDKEVKKMEDVKGLICQALGRVGGESVALLGCTPENLFPGEMYDAMSKGVINANVLEWEGEFVWNLSQVVKYSVNVGMNISNFIHVMNLDTWNSLPPDVQALFEDDNKWGELQGFHFDLRDIDFEKKLDEQYKAAGREGIYTLPADERARWAATTMPVVESWVQEAAAKVGEDKARAILADARMYAAQYAGYPTEAECPGCEAMLKKYAPTYP